MASSQFPYRVFGRVCAVGGRMRCNWIMAAALLCGYGCAQQSSVADQNQTFNDRLPVRAHRVVAGNLNSMMNPGACVESNAPSWCSGRTADVWIKAACSQLPPTGGIVDLRGFGATTQTIAASLAGCTTPTRQVQFLVNSATRFNITVSDGSIVLPLDNGSGITGGGGHRVSGTNGGGFFLTPRAKVKAVFGNAHEDYSQESMYVEGVVVAGATGATVTKGLIYAFGLGTPTSIVHNTLYQCNNACIWIENSGGAATMVGNWANVTSGNNTIQGSSLVLRATGGGGPRMKNWLIEGNTFEHGNGARFHDVDISGDGSGALIAHITLQRNYIEEVHGGTDPIPPTVSVQVSDCVDCVIRDMDGNSGNPDFIRVSQTRPGSTQNVVLENIFDAKPSANIVDDQVDRPPVIIPVSAHRFVSRMVIGGGYEYDPQRR